MKWFKSANTTPCLLFNNLWGVVHLRPNYSLFPTHTKNFYRWTSSVFLPNFGHLNDDNRICNSFTRNCCNAACKITFTKLVNNMQIQQSNKSNSTAFKEFPRFGWNPLKNLQYMSDFKKTKLLRNPFETLLISPSKKEGGIHLWSNITFFKQLPTHWNDTNSFLPTITLKTSFV